MGAEDETTCIQKLREWWIQSDCPNGDSSLLFNVAHHIVRHAHESRRCEAEVSVGFRFWNSEGEKKQWRPRTAGTAWWTCRAARRSSPRARGAGREVSSRGEQGAVRPAVAAGAFAKG